MFGMRNCKPVSASMIKETIESGKVEKKTELKDVLQARQQAT